MLEVFQSERFFREAWPQISHAFATGVDFSETELERTGKAWWPGSSSIQGLRGTERRFDVH